MQKLCFILFGIIITTGAFAADLCVRNDAMVVALNPHNSQAVSSTYDEGGGGGITTWTVRFPYGTISGIGACATDCNTMGCVATNQNMSVYGTGAYCYCKMLRPALSRWVFSGDNRHNGRNCAGNCAMFCATSAASAVAFRRGLFRSINTLD